MSLRVVTSTLVMIALTVSISGVRAATRAPQDRPIFSAQSELVVVHVTVKDRRGALVTDLPQDAFALIEDGQPQDIRFFSPADTPASIGVLIDNSTSMISKREMAVTAAMTFTKNSNPDDEVFVLAFNENVSEIVSRRVIKESNMASIHALLKGGIFARGMTALYDAISKGLDTLRDSRHTRQVLVLISDGGDNASTATFEQVTARTQGDDATLFAVALRDPLSPDDNPRLLKRLTEMTGGESFEPQKMRDLPEMLEHIARDIRAAYTLGYAPTNSKRDGGLRKLRVVVKSPDGRPLRVRTRTGYVAAKGTINDR